MRVSPMARNAWNIAPSIAANAATFPHAAGVGGSGRPLAAAHRARRSPDGTSRKKPTNSGSTAPTTPRIATMLVPQKRNGATRIRGDVSSSSSSSSSSLHDTSMPTPTQSACDEEEEEEEEEEGAAESSSASARSNRDAVTVVGSPSSCCGFVALHRCSLDDCVDGVRFDKTKAAASLLQAVFHRRDGCSVLLCSILEGAAQRILARHGVLRRVVAEDTETGWLVASGMAPGSRWWWCTVQYARRMYGSAESCGSVVGGGGRGRIRMVGVWGFTRLENLIFNSHSRFSFRGFPPFKLGVSCSGFASDRPAQTRKHGERVAACRDASYRKRPFTVCAALRAVGPL